ncbi:MAG: hypothetical protein ACYC91_17905 [Solirubrobacteraceae bacterium]
MLALGILGVFASAGSASSARHLGGTLARMASPTGDCDNDGDNPLGVEFEECSPAPAEPGKLYTPAQKAQFHEVGDNLVRQYHQTCGVPFSDPLTYLQFFNLPLAGYCTTLSLIVQHEDQLVEDPPDLSLFEVALPSVQPITGQASRCTLRAAICRRGRKLVGAYLYAFEQESAALGALATSLNRLASTPSRPESQFGTGAGSAPLYSRRTQAAAGRLYSGLLAAWNDRLKTARANLVNFLDSHGGKARRAAARLSPVLPSAPLWASFHHTNVFEAAQLFSALLAQAGMSARGQQPTGLLASKFLAAAQKVNRDMYQLYLASRAAHRSRARKLDTAANKFERDADKLARIQGLAAYAPIAPLAARLFGFAVEGLTNNKPAPIAAP